MSEEDRSHLFDSLRLARFKYIWSKLSASLNSRCVGRYNGLDLLCKAFVSCVGMGYFYGTLWNGKIERLQKLPLPEDGNVDVKKLLRSDLVDGLWLDLVRGFKDHDRKFFVNSEGYIGMADWEIQVGDEVCLLYSGKALYVVRKEGDYFLFLGDCYVPGLMDGEILSMQDAGKVKDEWIELR